MTGPDCSIHKKPMDWLATTNQWEYYCRECDQRYNCGMQPMPSLDEITRNDLFPTTRRQRDD